ncbi:tRNA (adenosine(37)-N6)-dimethylallyltransferase MiaA [Dawidia soli]|uniref:tRNA dimethylallyltransferase n=1 Tax=Dawidia soli TaxID=2782352 RepID=A0AAP2D8G7_9BACT|nr:tRNA (adenosine(37)-N6)-dimethylallyltransferase MiaA [Dawidia soli]MBT1687333.1 tRNA (adenosine(37)-N6)-dimethylallyltransferase MiaA [Dawidia soli]
MKQENKHLIVVAGPTAVGKTAVAIALAKHFHTEVISADSRQLFREMTLGTAKPTPEEQAEVRHHFIDSHSIDTAYDAAQYGRDALALIDALFREHNVLVLCGGSGLYIKAVLEGFDDIPEVAESIRAELIGQFEAHGIGWLQARMEEEDPALLATIDRQNPHRLIRALEVKRGTGQSIAAFRTQRQHTLPFRVHRVGLTLPREQLYARIDARMDAMIDAGLFEEARALYPFRAHNALQTVGYQEIFDWMDGRYDRDEAIRLLKRNSRRYAKRQLTWFQRDEAMRWYSPFELDSILHDIEQAMASAAV